MTRKQRARTSSESRARYYIRQKAKKRGWNTSHIGRGGDCLEEQEISAYFPNIGLGLEKPDFLFCLFGEPAVVIEAKNEADKLDVAIKEATDYADTINTNSQYEVKIAVGAAGEDQGFLVAVKYFSNDGWVSLEAYGYELTTIPSKREIELALEANDGTTSVSIPSSAEFIDVAIDLSRVLRTAKVEAPLRPKVVGAIILSMYQGSIATSPDTALSSINQLVKTAIDNSIDLGEKLTDALHLSSTDFIRLAPHIKRIVALLKHLNIRSVLQTDTDFLGIFYEAFIRYGCDNNALGIVFTPRHITQFCVQLLNINPQDRVIDIACGTGGFLVSSYDLMINKAQGQGQRTIDKIKSALYGFDTNPTVWALASLNMFFRGDSKSHIELGDCLLQENIQLVQNQFNKAFLNPPFSQESEPESDFVDAALNTLEPGGYLAVVVIAGIFSDGDHVNWRKSFVREHTILAVISLPEDLFYPVASAPTSILVAKAHIPQPQNAPILMARVWNDGYEKLKNRRIEVPGEQLSEVIECFRVLNQGKNFQSDTATVVFGNQIMAGEEWNPQQWLPQPHLSSEDIKHLEKEVISSIFQSVATMPNLGDTILDDFSSVWQSNEQLPIGQVAQISDFFEVYNGKSVGEKHYGEGYCPYISSGDNFNSIIRLVQEEPLECFTDGGITVTAFGQAYIQPWPFMARGNGGSSVRVLIPKFDMSFRELVWFAAQINAQRWRFFYARMSIKSRLTRLIVESPLCRIPDNQEPIAIRLRTFRNTLNELSTFS